MADSLFRLHDTPPLDEPVLVVALDGWIDAGSAAGTAASTIADQVDRTLVATFDTDVLLDFRARRPVMHLVDGVNTGLTWSTIEMHAATTDDGSDLLLLTGVEPDHAWQGFAAAVRSLAIDFGARMHVGLGAYPAGVPHTRPVQLSSTASTDELAASVGFLRGTLDVPAGIEAVIEDQMSDAGLPALGIWAQVPHYISAMNYPAAAARLIEAFNDVAGTSFSTAELDTSADAVRARIDAMIENNPEHAAMLHQLEAQVDEMAQDGLGELPSGEDLAEELEQFLRDQND